MPCGSAPCFSMAAPSKSSLEAYSDSSSDGEDLERLREAAWEPPGSMKKKTQYPKNSVPALPSLRVRPDSHEHDGNKLQTTPEFRAHVAKKLAAMLDNCIKEVPRSISSNQTSTAALDSEDEGFRLLSTSVPGDSGEMLPSQTVKRRAASSTSEDSEEELRCREAAVSALDILKHSALHTTPEEIVYIANNKQSRKKKKVKKERSLSGEAETDEQNVEQEGKINGCKEKKNKGKGLSDETQSDDQIIHPESKKVSKKNKAGSDCYNKSETVKGGSKKEIELWTIIDQNINPMCKKSGRKRKNNTVVENCDEHN